MHIDPTENLRPWPLVEQRGLGREIGQLLRQLPMVTGLVRTSTFHVPFILYTDSPHLRSFFEANWGADADTTRPLVTPRILISLRQADSRWPAFSPGFRYIDENRTMIVSAGSEYYGNVKISVRGLANQATLSASGCFIHGTGMELDGTGVVVSGVSGAGKTTITASLLRLSDTSSRIVNDDWGWADPVERLLAFTGEPHLHMKYRSVDTLGAHPPATPSDYMSENHRGDRSNPHARLLIPRTEVFGACVADACSFGAFVVVKRDQGRPFEARPMVTSDVELLARSEYSAFYSRNEYFLDGSLILLANEDFELQRERFRNLLGRIPSLLVNNVATPDRAATAIREFVRKSASGR